MKISKYKVTGTLKYGKIINKGFLVAMDIIVGILAVGLIVVLCFAPTAELQWSVIVGVTIGGLVLVGIWLFITIKHVSHLKKIKLWAEDAVLAKGKVERFCFGTQNSYQISVRYQKTTRILPQATFYRGRRSLFNVHLHFLNGLTDLTIPVLYSPKYDQVIFIQELESIGPVQ